jgi:hypothetical protein
MMTEPLSDSPFAEFADPKPSAADYLRFRREQDRKARWEYWLLLAILAGAAALAAAGGASIEAGMPALPAALGLAIAGTLLGVLVGWLVGAVSWAGLSFGSKAPAPFKPIGTELVQGNSWDKMTIWLSGWGAIGIASGGAIGATKGAALAAQAAVDSVMPWFWGGSVIGVALGFVCWLLIRRKAPAEPSSADREGAEG